MFGLDPTLQATDVSEGGSGYTVWDQSSGGGWGDWGRNTIDYIVRAAVGAKYAATLQSNQQYVYDPASGRVIPAGSVVTPLQPAAASSQLLNTLLLAAGAVLVYKLVS